MSALPQTLPGWLARLEGLHPERIELGLDRVALVHRALDLPSPARCSIVVAGTNGKGSVVQALQALLAEPQAATGWPRVGCYTSPHLLRFNERVRVCGREASDADLCRAFARIEAARCSVDRGQSVSLTYFEFTTLAALCLFADANLDYAILEVGLGGRLDAVNVVDADLAIITAIALDHEHWLGATRDAIAVEKAGILRSGRPCVIADPQPPASLVAAVRETGAHAFWAEPDPGCENASELQPRHRLERRAQSYAWRGRAGDGAEKMIEPLPEPQLQALNWSAALQAAALLGALPPPARCAELLNDTVLPGRRSRHKFAERQLLLDVAHNPASIAALAASIAAAEPQRPVWMIFAALSDKRVDSMIRALMPQVQHWIFPQLRDCPRALEADKMLQHFHAQQGDAHCAELAPSVAAALDYAVQRAPESAQIVVSGSFFTVSEALAHIEGSGIE